MEVLMSLLFMKHAPHLITLAQQIFDEQFRIDEKLTTEMDERRKQAMFQDILYNFNFLTTAVELEDEDIFTNYAVWLFNLLCNLMKDLQRERIKDQMVDHYTILRSYTKELYTEEQAHLADIYLDRAIEATIQAVVEIEEYEQFLLGSHGDIQKEYLNALLQSDTRQAIKIIQNVEQSTIPIEEIFEEILQPAMIEVGELWHQNKITIDKEHYCTSTTQMILSLFYPSIFAQTRKMKTLVACCIGSELHEMGGRMVSDLFEYHGWDSIYLGAAVPLQSLMHAVAEHAPDLIALSVTMPQYLQDCHTAVVALHDAFPQLKIAVGGRAFETSHRLWEHWPVDIYTKKASELIKWAETEVNV